MSSSAPRRSPKPRAFVVDAAFLNLVGRIGARRFVGVNATLRDGVKIGERCVIGLGADVLKDMLLGGEAEPSPVKSSRLRNT